MIGGTATGFGWYDNNGQLTIVIPGIRSRSTPYLRIRKTVP
ncbi:hypothetical protein ROSINTL182_05029 [Roseburia intestinalis L1-82]|uniref:Uncharacterized protein n=1 Tax=Roseburia intestinalis L1-82 TaxID=536231 RepID=C7G572_9FIRM|nr:hypothetical protein ROSINTL182_05029 [Roseburia intestinalis L1-82]